MRTPERNEVVSEETDKIGFTASKDKAFNPLHILRFCANAVMLHPDFVANLIKQFRRASGKRCSFVVHYIVLLWLISKIKHRVEVEIRPNSTLLQFRIYTDFGVYITLGSTMDPIATFLWDIFKNVLGNRADAFFFGKEEGESELLEPEQTPAPEKQVESVAATGRRFKTFDAVYDLEKILSYVDAPIVHLLIEDSPSTAYNLPGYVLESRSTGEWFVFSRGRLALQGCGGGHNNTESVFSMLSDKKTTIGAWVVDKKLLDLFENGQALWPDVKRQAVPLLAFLSEEYSWSEIQNQFHALSAKSAS
jgi:hypothetical protein